MRRSSSGEPTRCPTVVGAHAVACPRSFTGLGAPCTRTHFATSGVVHTLRAVKVGELTRTSSYDVFCAVRTRLSQQQSWKPTLTYELITLTYELRHILTTSSVCYVNTTRTGTHCNVFILILRTSKQCSVTTNEICERFMSMCRFGYNSVKYMYDQRTSRCKVSIAFTHEFLARVPAHSSYHAPSYQESCLADHFLDAIYCSTDMGYSNPASPSSTTSNKPSNVSRRDGTLRKPTRTTRSASIPSAIAQSPVNKQARSRRLTEQ